MANNNSPDSPPFSHSSPQINLLDSRIQGEILHQLTVVKTEPTKIGTICVASIPIQVNNLYLGMFPYLGGGTSRHQKKVLFFNKTIYVPPSFFPDLNEITSSVFPYFSFFSSFQKIPLATGFPLFIHLFQIVDDSLTTSLPFYP